MLANSVADVVAEEATTCFLLERNLECQCKACQKMVVHVAKRLTLLQGDIWATREYGGEIYELPEHQLFTEAKS